MLTILSIWYIPSKRRGTIRQGYKNRRIESMNVKAKPWLVEQQAKQNMKIFYVVFWLKIRWLFMAFRESSFPLCVYCYLSSCNLSMHIRASAKLLKRPFSLGNKNKSKNTLPSLKWFVYHTKLKYVFSVKMEHLIEMKY